MPLNGHGTEHVMPGRCMSPSLWYLFPACSLYEYHFALWLHPILSLFMTQGQSAGKFTLRGGLKPLFPFHSVRDVVWSCYK